MTASHPHSHRSIQHRRTLFLLSLFFIVLLALALGLGLGLTIGRKSSDNDNDDSSPSVTNSPLPSPSSQPLWLPQIGDTWQIALLNPPSIPPFPSTSPVPLTPDVQIYDIDLFDTPASTISYLHSLNKKVLCYFSGGSYEPNRPDSGDFDEEDMGDELEGWPGERWLKLSRENVRQIMWERLRLAAKKGCDGVDVDNVDGYVSVFDFPSF